MQGKSFGQKSNSQRSFGRKKQVKFYKKRTATRDTEAGEIKSLEKLYQEFDPKKAEKFTDFPLVSKTQLGLKKGGYFTPTEIQRESIALALQGHDILGAAKTGSGKTLAFLIPILQRLYQERWTKMDGVGALVITPTRELAYQIFEVLKIVGCHHDFSAGLIIGGKDLFFERGRMDKCNIIICTPGRLLQHMDENPLFDCSNMKILVLDEADRILDLGFQQTMNAIIENLPLERQTLLFSATQTKSVKDLARLSLKDPKYVSVHEHARYTTPETLQQSYMVCELHEKTDLLWSFIRNHRKQKILVFLASCKQVKYTYEVFCRMRPGLSVLALYGTLHQLRRMAIYDEFCMKQTAVLLATDIASRGLDFPSVDWVVHMDCPEDVNTYIHRAGRTARYERDGQSLLVLLPSEEKSMIEQLEGQKIPLQKTHVSQLKLISVQRKMEALCARDVKLKESAQRAFVSYLKSVFLMKDKSVFAIQSLDIDAYARSLGLAVSPRVRFLQKHLAKMQSREPKVEHKIARRMPAEETSSYRQTSRVPYSFGANAFGKEANSSDEDEEEEDSFLTVKRVIMPSECPPSDAEEQAQQMERSKTRKVITKAGIAKKLAKKKIQVNKKILFGEDGEEVENHMTQQKSEIAKQLMREAEERTVNGLDLEIARKIMQEEDKVDKKLFRKRINELHKEKKRKRRAEEEENDGRKGKKLKTTETGEDKEDDDYGDDYQLSEYIEALPDPDKISEDKNLKHNKKKRKERNNQMSDNSFDENERNRRKLKARKMKARLKEEMPEDTGLSLHADEELALHMLTSGK